MFTLSQLSDILKNISPDSVRIKKHDSLDLYSIQYKDLDEFFEQETDSDQAQTK